MTDQGLFGVAWQTKVERRRRGTKFVVPHVGFKQAKWLEIGWNLFQMGDTDRDYWMKDLNTLSEFRDAPAAYQRSVQWLRVFAARALKSFFYGSEAKIREILEKINDITAHSARVTLLDAAVHAGRSTEEIGLQANWKDPGPLVLKYTRNRTSVPAQVVQQLVKDIVDQQHPFESTIDDVVDVDQTSLDEVEFFVKSQGARAVQDYRYHCTVLGDSSRVACGRLTMEQCTSVGTALPDASLLCKHCARARPDVGSRCFFVQSSPCPLPSTVGYGVLLAFVVLIYVFIISVFRLLLALHFFESHGRSNRLCPGEDTGAPTAASVRSTTSFSRSLQDCR